VTRWILALVIVVAAAAMLVPVMQPEPPPQANLPALDEVLAYRISQDKPVVVKVPSSIDLVAMTTWAVIAPVVRDPVGRPPPFERTPICDVKARYPYAFEVAFVDETGTESEPQRFELESRLSCEDKSGVEGGEYAARLVEGSDWVLDPRTTHIETKSFLKYGGLLRLRAVPSAPVVDVVARLEGRYRRGDVEREVYEMSLDLADRQRISQEVTSIGFTGLPPAARIRALSGWERRLDAVGFEGVDYSLRRLLLRNYRTPMPGAVGQVPAQFEVGERHAAALNLTGPAELVVTGDPHRTIRVSEGGGPPVSADSGEQGIASFKLPRAQPRTVVIDAEGTGTLVRFILPSMAYAKAQIGDLLALPFPGERLEIRPDVRVVKYLSLRPDDSAPVVARLAPEQPLLGLLIRAELLASDSRDSVDGSLRACWQMGSKAGGPRQCTDLSGYLLRSRFERWGGNRADASDPRRAILRLPPGASRVEITGDPHMRVALRAPEPGVTEDILRLPYRVPLAEDESFRYAPLDTRTWTPIRAENQDDLERTDRVRDLYEQVRIEVPGSGWGPGSRPERVLLPERFPIRRRLLMPTDLAEGAPMPADGWRLLRGKESVVIGSKGPRAGRLRVVYRAHRGRLGQTADLSVNGQWVVSSPIVTYAGTLKASIAPGTAEVEVTGLGRGGLACADAAPAGGGEIVRRRDVFELSPKEPLTFHFNQKAGESLTVVLFVVTEASTRPWLIRYTIDGGKQSPVIGRFFRGITELVGTLSGRGGDFDNGLLWEAQRESDIAKRNPDGISRVKIRIGDDLPPGMRTLKLESVDRVWISAVLVGQPPAGGESAPRIWAEDDL
jgi:hypothetical protein